MGVIDLMDMIDMIDADFRMFQKIYFLCSGKRVVALMESR